MVCNPFLPHPRVETSDQSYYRATRQFTIKPAKTGYKQAEYRETAQFMQKRCKIGHKKALRKDKAAKKHPRR